MPPLTDKLADPERLAALASLRLLDSPIESAFDRLTHLAAATVNAPVCLVSLVDDRRQFFKSALGLSKVLGDRRETPLSHSFCQYVVTTEQPLIVPNSIDDPILCSNLAVSELGVRAYLGAPIHSPSGHVIGSFCVIDAQARAWRDSELDLVRRFAALVDTEIAFRASLFNREDALSRLQALVDSVALSFIATDQRGVITHFNKGAETLLGYTSKEVVFRHSLLVVHLTDEIDRRAKELCESGASNADVGFGVLTAGLQHGEVDEREWTYLRKDGGRIPVRVSLSPIRDKQGEVEGFLAIAQDISQHKRLEHQLKDARDEAVEASRLKSEFLAMMSHEIRTPMNAIVGMVDLLKETNLTSEQTEMAKTLSGGAEALLAIINDILDFSKIEAGQMRLSPAEFSLQETIGEVASLLGPQAREKGLAFLFDLDSIPKYLLFGDAGRIRQILINLVGNAIKFTEVGEVGMLFESCHETPTELRFSITVWDTGIGMSPDVQERLFRPFMQADGGISRRFGGTGLGLAIAKQLLSKMGGEISVTSQPDEGTRFRIEMTLERRGAIRGITPSRTVGRSTAAESLPLRLLVVEDNAANQTVIKMMLGRLGHHAVIVGNGLAALDELSKGSFDAVLMDCQLPILDGFETTRRIRDGQIKGVDSRIPIIALTAYARTDDQIRCAAAGMTGYVSKPIRSKYLEEALANIRGGAAWSAPKPQATAAAVLDSAALAELRDLGPEIACAMVSNFVDDSSRLIALFRSEIAAEDWSNLALEAHSLGGGAAVFGGLEVQRIALELEGAALKQDRDAASQFTLQLEQALAQMTTQLDAFVRELKS